MRILSSEFKETREGILCVIGAILIHISFGYFYTIGNMNPYFISYLNLKKGEEIWFASTSLAIQSISMPIGGFLARVLQFRIVACLSLLHSVSIILTRLTIMFGFIPTLLTYSILSGSYGLVYTFAVLLAVSWFPRRKGLITGLVIGGFGAGASLFNPIQYSYINPSNIKPNATTKHFDDPGLLSRIPNIFLICGFTLMGMQILGIVLLRKKQIEDNKKQTLSIMYFLKSAKFWLLWFTMLTATAPVTLLTSLYKKYGLTMIRDDAFLTAVGTCIAVPNMLGRVLWGFVSDYLSFKPTFYMIFAVWMFCNVCLPFVSYTTGDGAKALFFIIIMMSYSSIGGLFSLMPTIVARLFGTENMVLGYGLVYTSFGIGAISSSLLAQSINRRWFGIFFSLAGCNLIGGILFAFVPDENINPKLDFCKPITDRVWGKKVDLKAGEPTENDAIPTKENNRPEPENLQTE